MTYAELKAAIQAWMIDDSAELEAQLDTIIKRAELRLVREVDLHVYRSHATSSLTPSSAFLPLPDDTLVVRMLRIDGGEILQARPESFVREVGGSEGTPKYYAHWDESQLVLAPTPEADSAYTVELTYTVRPASIVTEGTTWLSENAEDVLMDYCFAEAAVFKQDQLLLEQTRAARTEAAERLQSSVRRNDLSEYRSP